MDKESKEAIQSVEDKRMAMSPVRCGVYVACRDGTFARNSNYRLLPHVIASSRAALLTLQSDSKHNTPTKKLPLFAGSCNTVCSSNSLYSDPASQTNGSLAGQIRGLPRAGPALNTIRTKSEHALYTTELNERQRDFRYLYRYATIIEELCIRFFIFGYSPFLKKR